MWWSLVRTYHESEDHRETSEIGGKEKALLWTSVALNTITILVLAALGIYEALDY